ncbi:MAG TPA: hypothetical protein DGX96_09295 [Lachnospiraceae bacterium]|jgi:hypothetical protein|nr:hypothetical protein [Lachnospiraceae bacterium]
METWTIVRIEEPDYGCEGVPDEVVQGKVLRTADMDRVVLRDSKGQEKIVHAPDEFLIRHALDEGSTCDPSLFLPFDETDKITRAGEVSRK